MFPKLSRNKYLSTIMTRFIAETGSKRVTEILLESLNKKSRQMDIYCEVKYKNVFFLQ